MLGAARRGDHRTRSSHSPGARAGTLWPRCCRLRSRGRSPSDRLGDLGDLDKPERSYPVYHTVDTGVGEGYRGGVVLAARGGGRTEFADRRGAPIGSQTGATQSGRSPPVTPGTVAAQHLAAFTASTQNHSYIHKPNARKRLRHQFPDRLAPTRTAFYRSCLIHPNYHSISNPNARKRLRHQFPDSFQTNCLS